MPALRRYSLKEIHRKLERGELPFSGITEKGSCEFHFNKPAFYAGVVMHAGSRIRSGVKEALAVKRTDRFREEDPYMDAFVRELPIQVIARDSRFEYDLNREPHQSIYPGDALKWGLKIWWRDIAPEERELSLAKHHEFHDLMDLVIRYMLKQNRYALIFDMHSYCYQREKRAEWSDDPRPEINLGTKPVNRKLFSGAIESFLKDLSSTRIGKSRVRAVENDIFLGGYLSRRLSRKWHENVLVLALEYKKIFMDEWTGQVYKDILDRLVKDFRRAADKLVSSGFFPEGPAG
jgi:N-formylglutamate amidohydrolase